MTRKLKPCPFCGSEVAEFTLKVERGHASDLTVMCNKCNAQVHIAPPQLYEYGIRVFEPEGDDAIDIWNRRAECKD